MKNLIILFSLLLVCFLNSSCEAEQISDETGIEEPKEQPTYKIDKEEVEPGTRG